MAERFIPEVLVETLVRLSFLQFTAAEGLSFRFYPYYSKLSFAMLLPIWSTRMNLGSELVLMLMMRNARQIATIHRSVYIHWTTKRL